MGPKSGASPARVCVAVVRRVLGEPPAGYAVWADNASSASDFTCSRTPGLDDGASACGWLTVDSLACAGAVGNLLLSSGSP